MAGTKRIKSLFLNFLSTQLVVYPTSSNVKELYPVGLKGDNKNDWEKKAISL